MRIGIVGCGNIGGALAQLFAEHHEVTVYDRNSGVCEAIGRQAQVTVAADVKEVCKRCDILVVAIQPGRLADFSKSVRPLLTNTHVIVSMAAGYSAQQLRALFPKKQVVRCMPNIALSCGDGVMACEEDPLVDSALRQTICALLKPAGRVIWLPEEQIEMVGALSGSGLAFVFVLIEALADAGIAMGLPASRALELATDTFTGAAALTRANQKHPAELKWRVTAPGGTTVAGLEELEAGAVRGHLIRAVLATYRKAKQLT